MIDICQINYLDKVESFIKSNAPYQPVLLIYDFSAPSMVVDEINKRLFSKCILTKYLSRDFDNDETLMALIVENTFRAVIILSSDYTFLPIANVLFIPTSFNTLRIVDQDINSLIIPDIIMANISNSNTVIYKHLLHLQNSLYESLFSYSIDNNKSICFELNQLINLINNFYIFYSNLDMENIIKNYFEIINKINVFLLKNNINIVKIDINDYFLQDFIFIQQIYYYIFIAIKNNTMQIFDIYKSAKKYVIFSKKYFSYINYFYSLCSDQNMQYGICNYCCNFASSLQRSLRAVSLIQNSSFTQDKTTHCQMKLAQELLQINIDSNQKSLLGYAKLINII